MNVAIVRILDLSLSPSLSREREGGRAGERERGRAGERVGGREMRGSEGALEREGGREGGREREGGCHIPLSLSRLPPFLSLSRRRGLLSLSLSLDLSFYDVAATWISPGSLGCQLDREESTIAAVLDLDKKPRVGARFGEKKS